MSRAGFGKVALPVPDGTELVGYPNRGSLSFGVHEPLHARALVLEADGARVVLVSVDLCWVTEETVAETRRLLIVRGLIAESAGLFLSATHTHSAPEDLDPSWPGGLAALIAQAVAQAVDELAPARVGVGWGQLFGHSINRRRLEDPIDPAVLVVRVDDAAGQPRGVYLSWACHPVVLGPDSVRVSGDFAAVATRTIEQQLGGDVVAVFGQGACADLNPLTPAMLELFADGREISTMVERMRYYGTGLPGFDVGDRIGATDHEVRVIGEAVAAEALRVSAGIETHDIARVWSRRLQVDGRNDGPASGTPIPSHMAFSWKHADRARRDTPLEIMLVGIDGPGLVLVGEPGEVFAATGVDLRRALRSAGIPNPYVIGYANGWRLYLPPAYAFVDAGYEVEWAWAFNLSETLHDDIRERVVEAVGAELRELETRP